MYKIPPETLDLSTVDSTFGKIASSSLQGEELWNSVKWEDIARSLMVMICYNIG